MNKNILIMLFAFLSLIPLFPAAVDAEDIPSVVNSNIDVGTLQPVVDVVRPIILKASVLVGGIFGLYIILIILRVHYERRTLKTLQQIRYDLDQWNQRNGIPSSREKKGFLHRMIIDKLFPSHIRRHQYPLLSPEHNINQGRMNHQRKIKKQ